MNPHEGGPECYQLPEDCSETHGSRGVPPLRPATLVGPASRVPGSGAWLLVVGRLGGYRVGWFVDS